MSPRIAVSLLLAALLYAQDAPPTAGTLKLNPKDGLKYVYIPAGAFQMGCTAADPDCDADAEGPAHKVTLTRAFWIGQAPVTQQAFQKVAGSNPSHAKGPIRPVENVTWNAARAYCTAIGGRLPTEAEFEYAARAGNTKIRPEPIDRYAWFQRNSGDTTHDVALKLPNAWGLYDVLGNVAQWVNDWATAYSAEPQRDPTGPATGRHRTFRGSANAYSAKDTRFTYRFSGGPDEAVESVGFRCAMSQ